ncbi:ACP S-malonyltransferase [Kineosporia sp. NBRC 101731]|uniref:ACP S-malonyltransferase n=1 Tax=Kineosporia sp. NBRC 101731 TaxID=3032199 RepID=UPI0024A35B41|nr:ACP S-malonyltransferase [Kineosporia sp. NBRC 101731]GLY32482.1 malonyl CoA-acyl carrier protein transacylase [Kineosporia sp. NBRC 101731]
MDDTAFVFPGQGSQQVGMGLDLLRQYPDRVRPYYESADEILGMKLSRLCWEGPQEALQSTSVTQPAVFLTSVVTLAVLTEHGLRPGVVAGHSLGEYAALVCAGVLEWTDALRLVRLRGQLMEAVNERTPGRMAAVLGLDLAEVEDLCLLTERVVEVANDNAPGQVVVSGTVDGVEALSEVARAAGATRVVALPVGAPFHCSLMAEVEDEFALALDGTTFRDPVLPVISSVTAAPLTTAAQTRSVLRRQLTGRVRWTEAVRAMAREGAGRFVEVGPGKVLGGLCRRAVPGSAAHATGTLESLSRTVETSRPALR